MRDHIIIAENATKNIIFAANELKKYLKKACGLDFAITDCLEDVSSGNVISLDVNKFSESAGYGLDFVKGIPAGGYVIKSEGKNVYILGKEDVQTVYGAYGLLEKVISFSAVAPDEVDFVRCEYKVPTKDIVYTPAIPNFAIGTWDTNCNFNTYGDFRNSALLHKGLASGNGRGGIDLERIWWGLWSHTQFTVLPPSKYADEHPDWFSEDRAQLCLTNEEMTKQFIENLKEIMLEKPDAKYFQLGASDLPRVCTCERCRRDAKLYEKSGIMLRFFRKVAEGIGEWAKKEIPEREYKLCILAYFDVTFAPSTKNEKTGRYEANDPSFIMPDNVAVMFAPLEMCYGHALNDESCPINYWYYNALLSWLPITKELMIWSYSTNFSNFAVPLNDYRKSMRANIKLYRDLHVSYVFVHANFYQPFETFQKMRAYILAQLMQDPDRETDALAKTFIDRYYKTAAGSMWKCYRLIEDNYDRMEREYNAKNKHFPTFVYTFNFDEKDGVYYELDKEFFWKKKFTGKNILQEKFFPESLLDEILATMEQGMTDADKIEDEYLREKVKERIIRETLPIKMLDLIIHRQKWSSDERHKKILEFKCLVNYFGLTRYGETSEKTFDSIIKTWED